MNKRLRKLGCCYSGKGRIGQATRERVLEFIEKHDYRPNVMAKGLAQKSLWFPHIQAWFCGTVPMNMAENAIVRCVRMHFANGWRKNIRLSRIWMTVGVPPSGAILIITLTRLRHRLRSVRHSFMHWIWTGEDLWRTRLLKEKRLDDLQRATEDKIYCKQLLKEYGIE